MSDQLQLQLFDPGPAHAAPWEDATLTPSPRGELLCQSLTVEALTATIRADLVVYERRYGGQPATVAWVHPDVAAVIGEVAGVKVKPRAVGLAYRTWFWLGRE